MPENLLCNWSLMSTPCMSQNMHPGWCTHGDMFALTMLIFVIFVELLYDDITL